MDYKQLDAAIDELDLLPEDSLVTKELLPVRSKDRHFTAMEMFWLWVGMSVLLTTFTLGATLYPSLSVAEIVAAVAVGNGLTAIMLVITGDIGIRYGITFSVYIRGIFGTVGSKLPALIRIAPAIFYLGFQSYLGAAAVNAMLVILTNGGWAGGTLHLMIVLAAFLFVQCWTTAKGVGFIAIFEKIIAPIMIVICIYILWFILDAFGIGLGDVLGTPAGEMPDGATRVSFWYAVTASMVYWGTMVINIMDFTRYYPAPKGCDGKKHWGKRNASMAISQILGVVLTCTFFAIIGTTAMVATGLWNPIDVIIDMGAPGFITIISLAIALLAQWSTNIGANILPPAYILATVFAPRIKFAGGCALAGILAFVMQPWAIADIYLSILGYMGGLLGGIVGLIIVDYYILRGCELPIRDYFKKDGQFRYAKGWNPAAVIAYLASFAAGIVLLDFLYLFSALIGGVVYFLLMRFWGAKKYNQIGIMERFNIK